MEKQINVKDAEMYKQLIQNITKATVIPGLISMQKHITVFNSRRT